MKNKVKQKRSTQKVLELYTKREKKSIKIEPRFDLKNATLYGGGVAFLSYINGTGLKKQFQKHVTIAKRQDSTYPMKDQLTAMVVGRVLGMKRIYHFEAIENDPLIAKKLGMGKLSDTTVLYKDLDRFQTETQIEELKEVQWQYAQRCLTGQKYVILDIDSTVETVYGNQEGVEIGFNPHKPGRGSYHPLLGFDGISRTCLDGVLRKGRSYTSTGIRELYSRIKKRLGTKFSIRYIRVDKGGCGEENFRFWEEEKKGYTIKMKMTKRLKRAALKAGFKRLSRNEEEIIEGVKFKYRATSWKRYRDVVVICKRPLEASQKVLWEELFYDYEAIVTNLDWACEDIWKFYNHRANCENMIKECKGGFGIDEISSSGFYPNYADLLIKLIGYNTFCSFKKEILPKEKRWFTITTIRKMFFLIPAIIVYHAHRFILRLSCWHPWREEWRQAWQKLVLIGYT